MKRLLQLAALFFLASLPASAQFTLVTGTITDPIGIPYANGTISAQIVNTGGVSPTLNGGGFSGLSAPVGLDGNGSFTMQLADNAVVVPAATQWQFTVNMSPGQPPPFGLGPKTFSVTITITGASQSISTQLTAAAPALTRALGSVTIVTASSKGAALNTSLSVGGGTDDTAILQQILNTVPAGGLELVIDGPALTTGLNMLSNTRIRCSPNGGLFLAANSNREVIRNVNRSGSTRTDKNLQVTDCFIHGNGLNQSTGSNQADHTVMSIIGFYGVANIYLARNHLVHSAAYEQNLDNVSNVLDDDNWYETVSTVGELTRDGIDVRGPSDNITIRKARIKSGDDSIALNTRPYTTLIAGPYNLGGNITGVLIEDIALDPEDPNGSWGGIDLISDGSFYTDDITIRRVSGLVQNYAVYLSVDRINTPAGNGDHRDIFVQDVNVNQVGTPFGAGIPSGLFPIDANVSVARYQNIRAGGAVTSPTLTNNAVVSILSIDETRFTVTGSKNIFPLSSGLYFEFFHHPNGALPLPWISVPGNVNTNAVPAITGNQLVGSNANIQEAIYGNAPTLNSTQYSQIQITNAGGDASSFEAAVFRVQPITVPFPGTTGTLNQYECFANNGNISLRKWVADSPTILGTVAQAISASDKLMGYAVGSNLYCFYNGTQIITSTDATFATGAIGFSVFGSGTHATITAWTGGSPVTSRSGLFIADQGMPCNNTELTLSAGWGTTATVTGAVGLSQTCEWTLTSAGTGQAANPTITDTLLNPLPVTTPSPSVVCEMRMVGGTGATTLIDQTTISGTAPVFTFGGTPAAASTYKVVRRCGP